MIEDIISFFADIFESIFTYLETLLSYVFNTISWLFKLIVMLPQIMMSLYGSFSALPPMVASFGYATVGIAVLLLILNRQGGD